MLPPFLSLFHQKTWSQLNKPIRKRDVHQHLTVLHSNISLTIKAVFWDNMQMTGGFIFIYRFQTCAISKQSCAEIHIAVVKINSYNSNENLTL